MNLLPVWTQNVRLNYATILPGATIVAKCISVTLLCALYIILVINNKLLFHHGTRGWTYEGERSKSNTVYTVKNDPHMSVAFGHKSVTASPSLSGETVVDIKEGRRCCIYWFNDIIRVPAKLRIIKIPSDDYQGRCIAMCCCKNLEWCSEKFDVVRLFVWRMVHRTYVYWAVIRRI